jgi:Flp pilus assembly protein TadD
LSKHATTSASATRRSGASTKLVNNTLRPYGQRGLNDEALEEFAAAVRYAPDSPEMHHDYGVALANAGPFDEAAAQFRETLRVQPDNPSAKANLARVSRSER